MRDCGYRGESERLKRHMVLGCSGVKCTAEFKGTRGQGVKTKRTLGGESTLGARCWKANVIQGTKENKCRGSRAEVGECTGESIKAELRKQGAASWGTGPRD